MARSSTASSESDLDKTKRQSMVDLALTSNSASFELLKWTLGALLVVNGGALAAVLGSDDLRVTSFENAALLYGGGLVAAIIGGACWWGFMALMGADQMRRAWKPGALDDSDIYGLKIEKATRNWAIAAGLTWFASITLFLFGSVNMAFIPVEVAREKAMQASREASYRLERATVTFKRAYKDPTASIEARESANDRLEAAYVDAEVAAERARRALGGEGNELNGKTD